ncbi:MAG: hypothetical protein ACM32O_17650 [Clostridia bacterium]
MMINNSIGIASGSASGWYRRNETTPTFYEELMDAMYEMWEQLKVKGDEFETTILHFIIP